MFRKLRLPAMALLAALLATLALSASTSAVGCNPGKSFVRQVGPNLMLKGKPFKFIGSNNYYLMYNSHFMTDAVLEDAHNAGFTAMRAWAAYEIGIPGNPDGNTIHAAGEQNGYYFHYWDQAAGKPAFNEGANGLQSLDYIVAKAGEEGIRLVLPLVNNWRDFGGVDQYVRWADAYTDEDVSVHGDFYKNATIRSWYKDWVRYLLNRTNSITGVKYKNDPTIMTWELGNELRCKGSGIYPQSEADCADPSIITNWANEMSTFIKKIDRNHLVSSGSEGFLCTYANTPENEDIPWPYRCTDGIDEKAVASLKNIDAMSFHAYPDHWTQTVEWTDDWIANHIKMARKLGKPAYLGEFGWRGKADRNVVFKTWLDTVLENKGAGALYWILSAEQDDGTLYPDYDGFTVYCPSPVCTTISNAGKLMKNPWLVFKLAPVADNETAVAEFETPITLDVAANDIAYGRHNSVVASTIDLDPATAGQQSSLAVASGTLALQGDGTVLFTPATGYDGKFVVQYTIEDERGRVSNVADIDLTVKPEPGVPIELFNFETDAQGWGTASWEPQAGSVATSTDWASAGSQSLAITIQNGGWFGRALSPTYDLSNGYASITFDVNVVGAGGSWTNIAIKDPAGTWCQAPGEWLAPGTIKTMSLDLLSVSCDLTQVSELYVYANGNAYLDNFWAQ